MVDAPIRVVLGEDNPVFARGLSGVLQEHPATELLEIAGDRDTLLAAVTRHRPDVLLTDLRMPPTLTDEGLQVIHKARTADPRMGAILLSHFAEPSVADQLLSTGQRGIGYLLKDRIAEPAELARAVQVVAGGGAVMDPDLIHALLLRESAKDDPLADLTPSERDVLRLIAEGLSNDGIAARLSTGQSAVEKHVSSIFRKLPLADDGMAVNRRVRAALFYLANCTPEEAPPR